MKFLTLRYALVFCALLTNSYFLQGTPHFTWSTEFDRAYDLVFKFQFKKAKTILDSLSSKDPDNLVPFYIQSDVDLIQFMNTERSEDKARLFNHYDNLFKKVSDLPKSHPRRAGLLGELYLKRGFVHLSSESSLSAAMDIYRSYNLYETAYRQDSLLSSNMLGWGIMQLVMGAIPENYQWYASVVGLNGNIAKGKRILNRLSQSAKGNSMDLLHARFTTAYVTLNVEVEQEVLVTEQEALEYPLFLFLKSEYLTRSGKGQLAIDILTRVKKGKGNLGLWYLEYSFGKTLVRNRSDEAENQLLYFINQYPGQNYLKSAYLYLSWHFLLQGDESSYLLYTKEIKAKGKAFVGADKQAVFESQVRPHPNLLQVRLAFDSGNLEKAEKMLESINPHLFSSTLNNQLWHYYRARIYERKGNALQAIDEYQRTVKIPFDSRTYLVPASHIRMAELYLSKGELEKAEIHFNASLEYNNYPYAASYQRQAKSALKTLK